MCDICANFGCRWASWITERTVYKSSLSICFEFFREFVAVKVVWALGICGRRWSSVLDRAVYQFFTVFEGSEKCFRCAYWDRVFVVALHLTLVLLFRFDVTLTFEDMLICCAAWFWVANCMCKVALYFSFSEVTTCAAVCMHRSGCMPTFEVCV